MDHLYDNKGQPRSDNGEHLSEEIREAIRSMVINISKSFIIEWYTSISQTNHDFVASCETLIEEAMTNMAGLCASKLDKYKLGQLVMNLLHEHVLSENSLEKNQSIERQINEHEYDICQNLVVRLFGLVSTEQLQRVIFTPLPSHSRTSDLNSNDPSNKQHSGRATSQYGNGGSNRRTTATNETSFQDSAKTTSALYTLVIAMLTKAVFMPIVESISEPRWLFAVIIWFCKMRERDIMTAERVSNDSSPREQPSASEAFHHCQQKSPTVNPRGKRKQSSLTNEVSRSLAANSNPPITITSARGSRSFDLEDGIDIAAANINFENPVCDSLKRPLDNIEIYATEEVKGSGSAYMLYCIAYDGLCHRHSSAGNNFSFIPENSEVPIIDKRATNTPTSRAKYAASTANTLTGDGSPFGQSLPLPEGKSTRAGRVFRRRMIIKRRFREFVILQLRLEENPKIRPYMKNIPKPTKLKAATQSIFMLPGITNMKLDQSTIKLRQRFLERFLIALNNSPFIANSYEFKEFFSYNVNSAAVNITKSKSLILQVNLNKVFVDSVRSAFSIIRGALPGDDSHNLSANQPDPDAWLVKLQQSTMKLHVQTRTSHSKMHLERLIDHKLATTPSSGNGGSSSSSSRQQFPKAVWRSSGGSGGQRSTFSLEPIAWDGSWSRRTMVKSDSAYSHATTTTDSSLHGLSGGFSRASSSNNSRPTNPSPTADDSRSSSIESVYFDATAASSKPITDAEPTNQQSPNTTTATAAKAVQICDSIPIASKLIEIVHYSISRDSAGVSNSFINLAVRFLLGKAIELQAVKLLEASVNLEMAAFCINGITSSIWDENDDGLALDLEGASLDEATNRLTVLLEQHLSSLNSTSLRLIPRKLLSSVISKQLRFYLSQLASQKRNKFVIYSFFVHLMDELETNGDQQQ